MQDGNAPAPARTTEGSPGGQDPDSTPGNEPPLPRPQRLTRSESNLLEWVMHDRPGRGGDSASAPSTLGEVPRGTAAAPQQSASVGMVEVGAEETLGGAREAGAGPNGETVQSAMAQAESRRLSRQKSRVLQWVMREPDSTLDSQDLFNTLDLDELGRNRSFRRQVIAFVEVLGCVCQIFLTPQVADVHLHSSSSCSIPVSIILNQLPYSSFPTPVSVNLFQFWLLYSSLPTPVSMFHFQLIYSNFSYSVPVSLFQFPYSRFSYSRFPNQLSSAFVLFLLLFSICFLTFIYALWPA